ncbi:MAG: type II toxin-antitoxin system HicB family antitoxin [Anaerolineae bacterium]|nr:type II toxin-antitoxin system HicB family antitoxin [Anaerolineae bacterium]
MRNVLLYTDEDGYWIAEVPSLPGCFSQGDTREEAIANIKEAIELYIEVLEAEGTPVPEDYIHDAQLIGV